MALNQILALFISHQDSQAKQLLALFLSEQPQQKKQIILTFLNQQLSQLDNITILEAIDIFAHCADLQLVDKITSNPVEEFQMVVTDLEDLGTYNRCGRRSITQKTSPNRLTYFNNKTKETINASLEHIDEYLEVRFNL